MQTEILGTYKNQIIFKENNQIFSLDSTGLRTLIK